MKVLIAAAMVLRRLKSMAKFVNKEMFFFGYRFTKD